METATLTWQPDVLDGYEAAPVGGITLVRRAEQPENPRAAVLHVHGYNDYFFQTHVADAMAGMGLAFYAVDMRRAGRSLRPGEIPHHIADIHELTADIGMAADAVVADAPGLPLVVHAHSTGGLAAAIWADESATAELAGLILNSPLFGLRLSAWKRWAMSTTTGVSRIRATQIMSPVPSPYTVALRAHGWEFDPAWKKPKGQPATAGWLSATLKARQHVARGLNIEVPVLVARSDSSGPDRNSNPLHQQQDVVVDTDAIAAYAPGLGGNVEELVVERGLHDLSLSPEGPRAAYLDGVGVWLDKVLG